MQLYGNQLYISLMMLQIICDIISLPGDKPQISSAWIRSIKEKKMDTDGMIR